MAGTSVDGLISGMSTAAIINQLMAVEARGQVALQNRVKTTQSAISALQSVNAKVSALATAADALTAPSALRVTKASSTSDLVSATAGTAALTGSLTFDVTRLAAAELHATTSAYALDATVADSSVTITKGGTATKVTLLDGKLSTVVAAVNAAEAGVRAAAVQVAPGQYKLQLTSTTTGAASDFMVTGLTVGEDQVVAGGDAAIRVGGAAGYEILSSTNTFTDVLPGVTFTARNTATNVTVEVQPDHDAPTGKVDAMVRAVNAVLEEIEKHTSWDAAARKGGPLVGDGTVRELQRRLLGAVAGVVPGGSLENAGIELTRDGRVTFDASKLKTLLSTDPARAERMLGPNAAYAQTAAGLSGTLSLVSASHRTVDGTYDVTVTQAATRATARYDFTSVVPGQTYSVTLGGATVSHTAVLGDDVAKVAAGLRAKATAAGMAVALNDTASSIEVLASEYGSATKLSVGAVALGAADSRTAGVDVAGSIGGLTAKGTGRALSTSGVAGNATDIVLNVPLTAGDLAGGPVTVGRVTVQAGFAQRMETIGKGASDRLDGTLTRSIEVRNSTVKGYNDQIAAWDVRLDLRRKALQKQFGNLEVALGRLRDQSSWLSGQIAGLPRTSS